MKKHDSWKKQALCLVLVLCAVVLSACQQKETYPTMGEISQSQVAADSQQTTQDTQSIFDGAVVGSVDYDDGSYDPASEEGGEGESVENVPPPVTVAPTMQSEYAGATPVVIDPIDKPTPTPLPKLTFTYATYESAALHLSFEAPAGWTVDESEPDAYTLTNPDPSMDYQAWLSIRVVPVNRVYSKTELTREIKGMLDTIKSDEGLKSFSPSNTASRTFLSSDGIYANYTGTTAEGVKVAGRVIACCIDKTLYIFRVAYPQGYTETYTSGVFNKVRNTIKKN